MKRKNILAIIQVRMGSTRLPGKVLKEVCGEPLLKLQLGRLKHSKFIKDIVVATTLSEKDDPIEAFCRENSVKCYRGSEDDVLDRFYQAARIYKGDLIVRLTGDCPLLSPKLCDRIIQIFLDSKCDFMNSGHRCAEGLDCEIFTFSALEKAFKEATRKTDREHITMYIHRNAHLFSKQTFQNDEDDSKFRITVDEEKDFTVVKNIIEHFGKRILEVEWPEIKEYLLSDSYLMGLNADIIRNEGYKLSIEKEKAEMKEQAKINASQGVKLWEKAKQIIPGAGSLLSKRAEMFLPGKWPAYYSKSKGIEVWDLDGNKYTDMCIMGIGANILGYGNKEVDSEVIKTVKSGVSSSLNCPEDVYLAEKLIEIHPWAQMVRYSRGGGEACSMAIRIARAASGKDNVAFCGYHGWHDWYLSSNLLDNKNLDGMLLPGLDPKGVPRALKGTSIPFNYNRFDELENIANNSNLGVIIMEPLRSQEPKDNFLQKVRNLATKKNIVLIFDEVSSGFRSEIGGIHLKYGVNPDMAVFGKALGNGYAISTVIGKKEVMDAAQTSFISSTFWTERIGPSAGLAVIKILQRDKPFPKVLDNVDYLKKCWLQAAKKHKLEIDISGLPSVPHIHFKGTSHGLEIKTLITQEMLKKGYLASTGIYFSVLHDRSTIDKYIECLDGVFGMIASGIERNDFNFMLDGPVCHSGFSRLA